MRTLPFATPLNGEGREGVFLDCMLASDDEASRRMWKMTVRTDSSRGEMVYQAEYDLQKVMDEECDLREALDEAKEAEAELIEAMKGVAKMDVSLDDVGKEMDEAKDAGEDLMKAIEDAEKEGREGIDADNGNDGEENECWARVFVPFDKFQLVRGPRLVPDGPKLNVTGGIFQIGMTLSKFQMGMNTTELENFRPGYFEMRIQRMGFYSTNDDAAAVANDSNDGHDNASVLDSVPDTLSEKEARKKRPLLLKMLLPIAKVFFSEKANRRKSAMRILREERGLSRGKAILFGIRSRKQSMGGCIPSVFKTLGILTVDSFRALVLSILKVVLLYPLRVVGAAVRKVKQMLGMKVKPSMRE